jgi:hypothetical protein
MTVKTSFIADIRYPANPLKPMLQGQGQNGRVLMAGLVLSTHAGYPFVSLNPVTSRGTMSKACGIEVAYDKATLTALADLAYEFSKSAATYAQEIGAGQLPRPPAVMEADIKYPKVSNPADHLQWPMSRGRNQRSYVSAIELRIAPAFRSIILRPYNSLGRMTPYCSLEVPFDHATLQAVADAFLKLAQDAP